jgi:peptidoglycan DL-endopeptidase CwlO
LPLTDHSIIRHSIHKTKTMPNKKPLSRLLFANLRRTRRSLVIGVLIASLLIAGSPLVVKAVTCTSTSDCQQQIGSLNDQTAKTQQSLSTLELQAETYQNAIGTLQAQVSQLQQQIADNQAKQASLGQQIIANQQEIATKKQSLSDDIKTMYIDGSMTTIEELATSQNLSAYVDKEEYRTVVQSQLTDIIQQIATLQKTLQDQKAQVDQLLTAEATQNTQLTNAQAQQDQLLALDQQQQDTYNSQVSANQAAISSLQKQQAAIIQAGTRNVTIPSPSGGSGGACDNGYGNGGYPLAWCNAGLDAVTTAGEFPSRECTSYAYWYFTQIEGHSDFQVWGNANQWLGTSSYPTHSSPQVGAVAVETAGEFGHVAIVQALPGRTYAGSTVPDGYVLVSEMNYDLAGHFRYSYSPLSKFAGYIY